MYGGKESEKRKFIHKTNGLQIIGACACMITSIIFDTSKYMYLQDFTCAYFFVDINMIICFFYDIKMLFHI